MDKYEARKYFILVTGSVFYNLFVMTELESWELREVKELKIRFYYYY